MSDDEKEYKRKKVVHFGSLDEIPLKNDSTGADNENIQVQQL